MADADSLIGTVLDGKYEIDRLLGVGGMGAVYAGTHRQLDRPIAIKVVRADLLADTNAGARFMREARAAARVEHPNAVHVYDFGQLPSGGAYLVMEYVDGVSLREVMRRRGRLPLATIADVLEQTAAAVAAAHAKGIAHRDIKPENVMVREDADGHLHVKVVDFGLAKLLTGNASSEITSRSEVLGTPKYMAPEQFSSERVPDSRVDVYALGVMLFELLAGRAPFDGNFSEVVGKHLFAPPPAMAAGEVSPAIEAVVRRALEKDPDQRYQSADELARAFDEARRDEREAATPTLALPGAATAPHEPDSAASRAPETARIDLPATTPEDLATRYARGDDDEEMTRVRASAPAATAGALAGAVPPTGVESNIASDAAGREPAGAPYVDAGRATRDGGATAKATETFAAPSSRKAVGGIALAAVVALGGVAAWRMSRGESSSSPTPPAANAPVAAPPLVPVPTTNETAPPPATLPPPPTAGSNEKSGASNDARAEEPAAKPPAHEARPAPEQHDAPSRDERPREPQQPAPRTPQPPRHPAPPDDLPPDDVGPVPTSPHDRYVPTPGLTPEEIQRERQRFRRLKRRLRGMQQQVP